MIDTVVRGFAAFAAGSGARLAFSKKPLTHAILERVFQEFTTEDQLPASLLRVAAILAALAMLAERPVPGEGNAASRRWRERRIGTP
ncbi:hypothetical protein [Homoserinimonas sp. OAct 916]|uniref:hypothetical protein n=1 Tax=Homoserinimonas sp. OAct 916 TaxID=2211450 RepID=UPI000DBE98AE|nr:hypothetical protein [Homoserinimonas sp. OAct 916]